MARHNNTAWTRRVFEHVVLPACPTFPAIALKACL